jgi:hypothetical protein
MPQHWREQHFGQGQAVLPAVLDAPGFKPEQ